VKILLTGATGFVGSKMLESLIASFEVDEVICLSRRPLTTSSPKVTVVLHEDFEHYDEALLDWLAECDACIWTLGGKASDLGAQEMLERVTHGFTLALATGIAGRARRPFTFCYLSGMGADPSESAWLPWERATRHLKGRTEKDLQALQSRHRLLKVRCFRPGGILPDETNSMVRILLAPIVVSVGELADALIAEAVDQGAFPDTPTILNGDIKRIAQRHALGLILVASRRRSG
jgi:nucleoside-diphosphate-sugar epimerase